MAKSKKSSSITIRLPDDLQKAEVAGIAKKLNISTSALVSGWINEILKSLKRES
jgi:predicted transcriptional regulator|tara:strand:+ start:1263 stop:1424 length:162 start_codon:yes stop_codon:yes gene_type:complete